MTSIVAPTTTVFSWDTGHHATACEQISLGENARQVVSPQHLVVGALGALFTWCWINRGS